MKTRRSWIGIIALTILCSVGANTTFAATIVNANISTDTTWTVAGSPYVVSGLSGIAVLSGVTLSIEPGVVVKFSGIVSLGVSGTLHAQGTAGEPIVFTSYRDDTVAGDTNGDGASTSPAPGDWMSISFASGSTATLDHVTIRYGRFPAYIYSDGVTISNSVMEDNGYGGIQIEGAGPTIDTSIIRRNPHGVSASDSTFTLTNSEIVDNTGYAVILGNSSNSTISGNTISGNGLNGLVLPSGIHITADTTWSSKDAAYCIGLISVLSGVTLTIEPGVVVKPSLNPIGVSGTLHAQGTAGEPIVFTSSKDDTVAGDTNGDGASTSPAPGDWMWISFASGSTATLDHVTIRYGRFPAYIYSDGVTISNSVMEDNGYGGIRIEGAGPTIQGCIIRNSVLGVRAESTGIFPVRLENNLIYDNTSSGISMLGGSDNFSILNNTITSNGHGISLFAGIVGVIQNNIITNNSQYGITSASASGSEITYNNVWGNGSGNYNGCSAGVGSLSADPLFADAAANDFSLLPESPCIDAANSEGAPPKDFEGKSRFDAPFTEPNTGVGTFDFYDIGALEYNPVCEGDFEPDGDVDGVDLNVIIKDLEQGDCSSGCLSDLDDDDDVDRDDLAIFTLDFGRVECPFFP